MRTQLIICYYLLLYIKASKLIQIKIKKENPLHNKNWCDERDIDMNFKIMDTRNSRHGDWPQPSKLNIKKEYFNFIHLPACF